MQDLRHSPAVLLDDSRSAAEAGRSLFFHGPGEIICAHSLADIPAALEAMDEASARGLHLAGWIAFEAAAHFEPSLADVLKPSPLPYIWMLATRHRRILDRRAVDRLLLNSRRGNRHFARWNIQAADDEESRFHAGFAAVKEAIAAGNVYQVNLTFRRDVSLAGDSLAAYEMLRARQPVAYGAYINTGSIGEADGEAYEILSLSPELFFEKRGPLLRAKPMKGTAQRGSDPAEDAKQSDFLQEDEKSRAENLMIVDLIRNDISRISAPGSVQVPALFETEKLPTLWQMTSTVKSTARTALKPSEALRALFPSGSVTGAPKIAAMEHIARLEQSARGVYCGAIGHFSGMEDWTFNVPIRTITLRRDASSASAPRGSLYAGAGLVYDSEVGAEYAECDLKARFAAQPAAPDFDLIETMLAKGSQIQNLAAHLDRLGRSADYMDFVMDRVALEKVLTDFAVQSHDCHPKLQALKIRLLLHRDGSHSLSSETLPEPAKEGRAAIAPIALSSDDLFLRHKTTHRGLYDRAARLARQLGLIDILFFNENGHLCEGSYTNVFIIQDGQWITPSAECGLLPGCGRARIILEKNARTAHISQAQLLAADAVYLCNDIRGLIPVTVTETLSAAVFDGTD